MESNHDISDATVWNLFRQGDKEAYFVIYERYVQVLCNYGDKISKDRSLTEDCVHDLFLELWNHRETLGETDAIKFYLFKSLRRKIIKEITKKSAQIEQHSTDIENYDFEVVFSFESAWIAQEINLEEKKRLTKALQQLSARQKEAIFLKFYDDLSYEEVAEIMSMELKSAYNLISKAVVALRKNIRNIPLQQLLTIFL